MQQFLRQLLPFFFIGVAVVAFAFGIILLAYLFLFGAFIGFILFAISWIRNKFFTPKSQLKPAAKPKSGRIIDSDDWKNL